MSVTGKLLRSTIFTLPPAVTLVGFILPVKKANEFGTGPLASYTCFFASANGPGNSLAKMNFSRGGTL
jgi:hypothetical protein